MKRIRKGKDIHLKWHISLADGVGSLDSLDLRVVLTTPLGKKLVLSHIIEGDAVVMDYRGQDHDALGVYKLTAWASYNQVGQSCVDACKAFELVRCTDLENDGTEEIDNPEVELYSTLEIGVKGESAYQSWLNQGYEGTEADFVNWIQQPSADAGAKAMEMANLAEEKATLANSMAEYARGEGDKAKVKAEIADASATNANAKAVLADTKAQLAQTNADYAKEQGDYAKEQTEEQIKRIDEQMELALDGSKIVTNIHDI